MGAAPARALGEKGEARRPPLPRLLGAQAHVRGPEEGGRDGVGDRRVARSPVPSPSVAAGGGSSPSPGLAQGPCNYPGKIALLGFPIQPRRPCRQQPEILKDLQRLGDPLRSEQPLWQDGRGKNYEPPQILPSARPWDGHQSCPQAAVRSQQAGQEFGAGREGEEEKTKPRRWVSACRAPILRKALLGPWWPSQCQGSPASQPGGTRRPRSLHPLGKGRPEKTGRKQPQKGFSPMPARAEAAEAAVQAGASPTWARGELRVQT